VPSDLVLTVLGHLVPSDLAQKALLLGIFVIAASGIGALLRRFSLPARLTGAFFFCWNPYVAERLLIGHWALLYGYAAMPWVLWAVGGIGDKAEHIRWRQWWRLPVALLPAAVGGFTALLVAGIVLAGACAVLRSWQVAVASGVSWIVCSLPWLVPSLIGAGGMTGDPAGVDAFASRADTPTGMFGSLLMLGGIWNADSVPDRYADLPLVVMRILLTLMAFGGVLMLGFGSTSPSKRGLAVLAVPAALGVLVAGATSTPPGRSVMRWLVGEVPAVGAFRDAQQFLAPLAVLEAVGLGVVVAGVLGSESLRERGARVYACTAMLLPVLALPQLAWGVAGTLTPVQYPSDWTAVRRIADGDAAGGKLVVLPWAAYRLYAWDPGTVVFDPAVKAFARPVVADDDLAVGGATVAGDDPAATAVATMLQAGGGTLTAAECATLGVRYVLVEASSATESESYDARLPGLRKVYQGPDLALYRVDL
jgi:hypothetical protein